MSAPRNDVTVELAGRRVSLSNLDRLLWPEAGVTKGEMIAYYQRVAPALLPHLAGRPLTLKRYPEGVDGPYWFDKQCVHRPDWLPVKTVASVLIAGKTLNFCLIEDVAGLVWAAQHAAIELHPLLAVADDVHKPTVIALDLDPGPPAGLIDACRIGLRAREVLDTLGLVCFPKTSGKGLHVYLPLNTPVAYDQTKRFARAVARLLVENDPRYVIDRMDRSLRRNKVFVHWSQNDATKTTVVAYSLRAQPRPVVSAPVTWDEVEAAVAADDPDALTFEASDALERVERHGDLFRPVLEVAQELPSPAQTADA